MSTSLDKPLFSIICPIYNCEEYLEEAIESVRHQTFDNWELVLIDDGSVDKSSAICKKYVECDFRIRYLFQQNSGQFLARLNGINHSNGEYIVFLDSDDTLKQNALLALSNVIKENRYDFIFFNADVITGKKNRHLFSTDDLNRIKNNIIFETIVNGTTGWSCCKAIKNSILNLDVLKEIGGRSFKLNHNEDLLLTCSCLGEFNTVFVLERSLYNYFKNRSKISYTKASSDYLNSLVFSLNYRKSLIKKYDIDVMSFNAVNQNVVFFHLYSIYKNKKMSNCEKSKAILFLLSDPLFNQLYLEWLDSSHSFRELMKKNRFMIWRRFHG